MNHQTRAINYCWLLEIGRLKVFQTNILQLRFYFKAYLLNQLRILTLQSFLRERNVFIKRDL